MDAQQREMYGQLSLQIEECNRRLFRLVNDADEAEIAINDSQSSQRKFYDAMRTEVSVASDRIDAVGELLKEVEKATGRFSLSFRELLKKGPLDALRERIDAWPLESFVTVDEFDRSLLESLRALR